MAAFLKTGINRNIVECKGSRGRRKPEQLVVLIETSWNVKNYTQNGNIYANSVLIETSWNVKRT